MAGWQVTEQAIAAMNNMSAQLQELASKIHQESEKMKSVFEDTQDGLGAHSGDISELVQSVELAEQGGSRPLAKLQLKLTQAARIRQNHIDKNKYKSGSRTTAPISDTAAIMGRIYEGLYRSRITPRDTKSKGEHIGSWQGEIFCPVDSVVPSKFNPEKLSFGEIKMELERKYGLQFNGVPYVNGYADFSSVAVAKVNLADVVERQVKRDQQKDPRAHSEGIDFDSIYKNLGKFDCADEIAADNQIDIPGLAPGYTKKDLKAWRKEHHFTWDESFDNGYILVPSIVHGNIPHTGLVGVATHGSEIERNSAKKLHRHHPDGADDYVSEEDAIISISKLEDIGLK